MALHPRVSQCYFVVNISETTSNFEISRGDDVCEWFGYIRENFQLSGDNGFPYVCC